MSDRKTPSARSRFHAAHTEAYSFLQNISIPQPKSNYTIEDALRIYESRREAILEDLRIKRVQENIRNKIKNAVSKEVDLIFGKRLAETMDIEHDMSRLLSDDEEVTGVAPAPREKAARKSLVHSDSEHEESLESDASDAEAGLFMSSVADLYRSNTRPRIECAQDVPETTVHKKPLLFSATKDQIAKKLGNKEAKSTFGFTQLEKEHE